MVVTTRSAAKRHYQSENKSVPVNTSENEPVAAKRVCEKKKQNEQSTEVFSILSSSQSDTTTSSPTSSVKDIMPSTISSSGVSSLSSSSFIKLSSIIEQDKPSDNNNEKELVGEKNWPIIVDNIEWCKTNRGNNRLCMGGYTYDLISCSLKNNSSSYRCSKKDGGCRAIVYTCLDSNMFKNSNHIEHNHPPNHSDVKRLLVMQKIKERVITEPTSVTRIIEDEYVKHRLSDDDRQNFLLPVAQASKFYKIRAKMLPPNPKSLDFEVPESCSKTHNGEEFLIYDSTRRALGGRLMIFSSKALIEMLCECEVILIDGTFKTRPILFAQVYVIMGKHLGEVVPLVWCLTPKKTQSVYEKILNILKKKANEYGANFEPRLAYLDFEVAAINALENTFPNIIIHGCWYHFTQGIYRNIQKIGLSSMYEKKKDIQTWLRSFMALPLLKHNALDAGIKFLTNNTPTSNNLLHQFIEYFQNQWMTRVPSRYWNVGPIHLRCNNAVEAYNNRLQHRFGMHPQLWSFIHFLKGEESLVMMRTKQIRSGNYRHKMMLFSSNTQRAGKKTNQIKNLARLYEMGTIGIQQYVTSLSFFVGQSTSVKAKKKSPNHDSTTVLSNGAHNNDGGN